MPDANRYRNLLRPIQLVTAFGPMPSGSWAELVCICPSCEAAVEFMAAWHRAFCLACGQELYRGGHPPGQPDAVQPGENGPIRPADGTTPPPRTGTGNRA